MARKRGAPLPGGLTLIALLARPNQDAKSGARGLSLFIVEKDQFPGHDF